MRRITISLSAKNDDAATVVQALARVKRWKRSAELLRWAAAYLNGEALEQSQTMPTLDMTEEELDALLDDL